MMMMMAKPWKTSRWINWIIARLEHITIMTENEEINIGTESRDKFPTEKRTVGLGVGIEIATTMISF